MQDGAAKIDGEPIGQAAIGTEQCFAQNRIGMADRYQNLADRFAAGHDFVAAVGKRAQEGGIWTETTGYSLINMAHLLSIVLIGQAVPRKFTKNGGRSPPSSSAVADRPYLAFFCASRRNLT